MRERTYLGKSKPWSEMVYSCLKLKSSMQCAHHIVIISRASLKYNLKTKTPKLPFYEKSHAFFKTRDTNVFSFGLHSLISRESPKRTPWPSYEKWVLITNTDSLVMGSLCLSNQPPMALSLGHTVLRLWRRSLQLAHHQISTGDHRWDTNSRTLCLPESLCTPTSHDPPAPQVSHQTIHTSCDRPTPWQCPLVNKRNNSQCMHHHPPLTEDNKTRRARRFHPHSRVSSVRKPSLKLIKIPHYLFLAGISMDGLLKIPTCVRKLLMVSIQI